MFNCVICGADTYVAPDPPAWAFCVDCCPEHEFVYDYWRRGKFCVHCDREQHYEPD